MVLNCWEGGYILGRDYSYYVRSQNPYFWGFLCEDLHNLPEQRDPGLQVQRGNHQRPDQTHQPEQALDLAIDQPVRERHRGGNIQLWAGRLQLQLLLQTGPRGGVLVIVDCGRVLQMDKQHQDPEQTSDSGVPLPTNSLEHLRRPFEVHDPDPRGDQRTQGEDNVVVPEPPHPASEVVLTLQGLEGAIQDYEGDRPHEQDNRQELRGEEVVQGH